MKLIFLGQIGTGKGTYASKISSILGIPHISTGQILREEIANKTEIGIESESYVKAGKWVPDGIIMKMIKQRLKNPDCKKGFIFDGFPRTIPQAEALEKIANIDVVINLIVPENVLLRRITSRRTCRKCGEIYNILTVPPKKRGICDKCGGGLYQREDEKLEPTKQRMKEYENQTAPLINYYKKKGKLKNIKWEKKDVPKGEIDVPVEIMVGKILKALNVK